MREGPTVMHVMKDAFTYAFTATTCVHAAVAVIIKPQLTYMILMLI